MEQVDSLIKQLEEPQHGFRELLAAPTMKAGIVVLSIGSVDWQVPHDVDEMYYVISGSGGFTNCGKEIKVSQGEVIYVRAGDAHRFHSITRDLILLVVFSVPAEGPMEKPDLRREQEAPVVSPGLLRHEFASAGSDVITSRVDRLI